MRTFDLRNTSGKTSTRRAVIASLSSLSLLLAIAIATPAMATMNNGGGANETTRGDLENDGWTCEVAGVGFWICSKDGHKDQWCDTHSCGPAPARRHPLPPITHVPTKGILAH